MEDYTHYVNALCPWVGEVNIGLEEKGTCNEVSQWPAIGTVR